MIKTIVQLGALGLVLLGFCIYLGYRYYAEIQPGPCSPGGYPLRCYEVSPKMCAAMWSKSTETCKAFIQKFDLPPGRLTGPITFRCQLAILDTAFGATRRSNDECDQMYRDLEEWKQRNDFKE